MSCALCTGVHTCALPICLAARALLVVARLAGLRLPVDRRTWLAFAGMGILNNLIPFVLIFYGQTVIGAGLAAVINGMTPFWTALIARAVGVEPLSEIGTALVCGSGCQSV